MLEKLENTSTDIIDTPDKFGYYQEVSNGPHFKLLLDKKIDLFILGKNDNSDLYYKENYDFKDRVIEQITSFSEGKIDINDITGIEGNNSNVIVYYYDYDLQSEKELVFDLNAQENESLYVGDNSEAVFAKNTETINTLGKQAEQADLILQVMDYVFNKNEEEWFDELNNEDKVDSQGLMKSLNPEYRKKLQDSGLDFEDMNLLTLQEKFEEVISNYSHIRTSVYGKKLTSDTLLLESKQKYLDMLMGIGDKYEGAASYLKKSENTFENLLIDINQNKTIPELFQYLLHQHETIDSNDYQSTTVEKSYKIYMEKLQGDIFQRLKDENATEKQFLDFAKIITGRYYDNNIDDNLRNQELSNEVVLYIISRKGGTMDKISSDPSIIIEDEKVGDKSPTNITLDTFELLKTKTSGNEAKNLVKLMGFGDISDLLKDSYNELSVEGKIKVSILVRMYEKIQTIDGNISVIELGEVFRQVAKEANETVIDSLNDNFDASLFDWEGGKTSQDYEHLDLSDTQKELFDLYQDINGNGLFDFSDNTVGYAKIVAKVTAAIVAGIAVAPFVAGGAVIAGVAVGLTATAVSMALNPQGYDTQLEAGLGITGELGLGAATGAAGGWVVGKAGFAGAKFLSKGGAINSGIFAGDLLILGLGVEIGRQYGMNEIFHNQDIFQEENTTKK